jgi:predicted CXXCH cytochrome family protein
MRRANIFAAVAAAVMLCVFTLPGHAQSPEMKIANDKAFPGGLQRGAVMFSHDKHNTAYGIDCTTCHHRYDPKQPGKNLWEMGDETSCAACHSGVSPKGKIGMKDAYHKLCWGCHEKQPESKKLAFGPRSCAGCHEVK